MLQLGVILSSGGAAFEQVARITASEVHYTVVTDRPCGAEVVARELKLDVTRIDNPDRAEFSSRAADVLRSCGAENALLFFNRLVSEQLFDVVPTFNIHPAALPAFPGLTGVEDAHRARVRLLGCTLHRVDHTVDGGAIVAQIACAVDPHWDLARWQKLAFLMKVYCGLVWTALALKRPLPASPINASHALPDDWLSKFERLQETEGARILAISRSREWLEKDEVG